MQAPGADAPARWHCGAYAGDAPVPGTTCNERARILLDALPRYARHADVPDLVPDSAAVAACPFLFNRGWTVPWREWTA